MIRFRISYGADGFYVIEEFDHDDWSTLYEPDDNFPTAHLMCEILNEVSQDGIDLSWDELEALMVERGWQFAAQES